MVVMGLKKSEFRLSNKCTNLTPHTHKHKNEGKEKVRKDEKYFYCNRKVDKLNKLSEEIVKADNINFKKIL